MRILCSFPGRYGDLAWALPTVRAIAEAYRDPVDLQIAGEFASIVPLLDQQPYLDGVHADPAWSLTPPDEWNPPRVEGYTRTFHLGNRGWPQHPLPFNTQAVLHAQWPDADGPAPTIDLSRPWITVEGPGSPCDIAVGFTEAWFELKLGLLGSVTNQCHNRTLLQLTPHGTRWRSVESAGLVAVQACDWLEAARAIRNSDLVLADCSALHVLGVAMGKPVVVMEPMTARLDPIFWPLGKDGPQVTLVRGLDGESTFDARHCAETLERVLHGR